MNPKPDFQPGFRVSGFDLAVLIAGVVGSVALWRQSWWAGAVVGFVVGHFFLFCNVFRIPRTPELIWASAFTGLAASTVLAGQPGWSMTFASGFILAVVLIAREMKSPGYHGIFWRRVNPGLREWWEMRRSGN
jgi:hypothetical protein